MKKYLKIYTECGWKNVTLTRENWKLVSRQYKWYRERKQSRKEMSLKKL